MHDKLYSVGSYQIEGVLLYHCLDLDQIFINLRKIDVLNQKSFTIKVEGGHNLQIFQDGA